MNRFLPYSRQTIEPDDMEAVREALNDDFLTTGPRVEAFEGDFAFATQAANAVCSNSGTAALHLPLLALGIGPGDVVVVPAITFVATANAVRLTGAEVMFADVDADTGLMTADTLQRAIDQYDGGARIVGAMPVHLNGQIASMEQLAGVAEQHNLWMVEDACHALGAYGIGACEFSVAAAFSTHAVKGITTAEGGVTTTANTDLADHMRRLRSHGITRDGSSTPEDDNAGFHLPWYYEMVELGFNYRMPDLLCALGQVQLAKLPRLHARRQWLAAEYQRLLAPHAPTIVPVPRNLSNDGLHLFPVLIEFEHLAKSRASVVAALRAQGIGTQVHYIPVPHHPYYRSRYGEQKIPGATSYYARCLSLPFFPTMDDDDVSRVVEALSGVCSSP